MNLTKRGPFCRRIMIGNINVFHGVQIECKGRPYVHMYVKYSEDN